MAKQPAAASEGDSQAQETATPAASQEADYEMDATAALSALGNLEQTQDEAVLANLKIFAEKVRTLFLSANPHDQALILRKAPEVSYLLDSGQFSKESIENVTDENITRYIKLARAATEILMLKPKAMNHIVEITNAAKAVQSVVKTASQAPPAAQHTKTTPAQGAQPSREGAPPAQIRAADVSKKKTIWEKLLEDHKDEDEEDDEDDENADDEDDQDKIKAKEERMKAKEERKKEKRKKAEEERQKAKKERKKKWTKWWEKSIGEKAWIPSRWLAHRLFGKKGWMHKYVDYRSPDYVLRRKK